MPSPLREILGELGSHVFISAEPMSEQDRLAPSALEIGGGIGSTMADFATRAAIALSF